MIAAILANDNLFVELYVGIEGHNARANFVVASIDACDSDMYDRQANRG